MIAIRQPVSPLKKQKQKTKKTQKNPKPPHQNHKQTTLNSSKDCRFHFLLEIVILQFFNTN